MSNTKITTIDEIKKMAEGDIVNLPPFSDGQELVVRLKRPSILNMAKNGQIPNRLLKAASTLFMGVDSMPDDEDEDDNFLIQLHDVIDVLAEASFVEPTWKELKEAKIELNDEQLIAIYQYSQEGVKALEPFRKDR